MDSKIHYLIFLTISPIWIFFLHIVSVRLFQYLKPNTPPLSVAAYGILSGYMLMGAWSWFYYLRFVGSDSERFCAAIFGALVYTCLAFCYFILFAMTESARRIHILRKLYLRREISVQELASEYGAANMLSVRLARMTALKQLRVSGNRYFLYKCTLLYVGKVMSFWSKLLRFSEKGNS